jgi:hypothetical protein
MIIRENLTIGGRAFVKTYSDIGMMVEREEERYDHFSMNVELVRVRYSEAIDPAEFGRQYTETDEPIEAEETEG